MCSGHKAVVSFILKKSIFLLSYTMEMDFYERYINEQDIISYIDDGGSGVKPKQFSKTL